MSKPLLNTLWMVQHFGTALPSSLLPVKNRFKDIREDHSFSFHLFLSLQIMAEHLKYNQRRIQQDFDTSMLVWAPKLWCSNSKPWKSCYSIGYNFFFWRLIVLFLASRQTVCCWKLLKLFFSDVNIEDCKNQLYVEEYKSVVSTLQNAKAF